MAALELFESYSVFYFDSAFGLWNEFHAFE